MEPESIGTPLGGRHDLDVDGPVLDAEKFASIDEQEYGRSLAVTQFRTFNMKVSLSFDIFRLYDHSLGWQVNNAPCARRLASFAVKYRNQTTPGHRVK